MKTSNNYNRMNMIGRISIFIFFVFVFIGFGRSDASAALRYYQLNQGGVTEADMSSATTIWNYSYRANSPSGYYDHSTPPYTYNSLINLGFTFPYNGSNYTQVRVYTSGLISLGSGTVADPTTNNLAGSNGAIIAPFWEESYFTGPAPNYGCGWSNRVAYRVTGTAPNRVFVVEWRDMGIGVGIYYGSRYGWCNRGTFQAQLFENGDIAFYYKKMEWKPSCSWWSGYENYGMTNGITGSIGLGQSSTDFLSVTPGSPASASTTTAKNDLNLQTQTIAAGTGYLFVKQPEVRLSATPKIIDYGTVSAGAFANANVVIRHAGVEGTLNILSTTITGTGASQFSIISTPGPLAPGQQANMVVRFTPTLNGTHNATLTINSNGVDSGTQQILLSGRAIAPTIEIIPIGAINTPTRMYKKTRTMVGDSLTQSFLVKNIGAGTLIIQPWSGITGENASHYSITRWPQYPVAADNHDTMSITFAPTVDGGLPARAELYTNATNGTQYIDLFGVGVVPRIELTPGEMMTFDSVAMGSTICKKVKIFNPGTDTLRILQDYMSSSDGDFSYTGLPRMNGEAKIAPNDSAFVDVCITPLQKGTRRARLRFTTNIPLTFEDGGNGGGEPDGIISSQSQQSYPTTPTWIRNDTSAKTLEIWANAVPSDKTIISMGEFADAVIGTESSANVTFTNAGSETIKVEEPFFSGVNAGQFKATKAVFPLDIAPGASVNFTVVGTPKLRGENIAVMNIANKSEDRQYLQSANVRVKGLLASSALDQSTVSYEKQLVGEESSKTITVANNGDIDQNYTATVTGEGFALVSEASSGIVTPGMSVVYTLKYAPQVKGVSIGSVTIKGSHIADMVVALDGEAEEKPVTQSVKGDVSMNGFVLSQNAPNPATGSTAFSFTTPSVSTVRIVLVDMTGKTIRELANGIFAVGEHKVSLQTGDITSGSYLYILESEGVRLTRQMVVNK